MSLFAQGALLAIDWGAKKCGFASCDADGIAITPRPLYLRPKRYSDPWRCSKEDLSEIQKRLEEYDCQAIVLGDPRIDSSETPQAKGLGVSGLAAFLKEKLNIPVLLVSEYLSSWEGEKDGGDDSNAAAVFLEDLVEEKKRAKKSGKISLIVLFCLLAMIVGSWRVLHLFYVSPHKLSDEAYTVDIPPGSSFAKVFEQLSFDSSWEIIGAKIWLKTLGAGQKLRVGEYELNGSMSRLGALKKVLKGAPIYRSITIREGNNIWDIQAIFLEKFPNLSDLEFQKLIRDPQLLARMGISQADGVARSLEGFLFPETYTYQKYHEPQQIIENMLSLFEQRALPHLQSHPWASEPGGMYRLLTLASIVEKESSSTLEQPVVASVFWNRIDKRMKLQSDPTIIYPLLPEFDGNIRKKDIRAKNNYNTYTKKGLPVGPISNPGESSIKAVVRPAKTSYLFFVSKNDGTHAFSETYAQHKELVYEYQIKRRRAQREAAKDSN